MDWLHTDGPAIGRGVSGVYDILTTPIYAIIRVWNRENKRTRRATGTRRRSYERIRTLRPQNRVPLTFESPYEQQSGWVGIGTGKRKRSLSCGRQLEEQMTATNHKKRKLDHVRTNSSSLYGRQTWTQDIAKGVEPARKISKHQNLMRSTYTRQEYTDDRVRREYDQFRKSRPIQRTPLTPSINRPKRQLYDMTQSDDSSSDHENSRSQTGLRPDLIKMKVPEKPKDFQALHDERINVPSRFSLAAVMPISPAISTDQGLGEPAAPKSNGEENRHAAYLEMSELRNSLPSPRPSPPRTTGRDTQRMTLFTPGKRQPAKSFFRVVDDPVQNSPGAFPREESAEPLSEDEAEDIDDPSDSSRESATERRRQKVQPRLKHVPAAELDSQEPPTISAYDSIRRRFHAAGASVFSSVAPYELSKSFLETLNISSVNQQVKRTRKSPAWERSKTERRTRQQKEREEREAALARGEYALTDLSEEWDQKVRQAVKGGTPDGKYSSTDLARVVPEYSARGKGSKWLNDAVINDYIALVARHGNKHDRKDQVPSFAALSSFFYTKITPDPKAAPPGWTKRAKIPGRSLLDCGMVFIPINEGMHWTLCVIEPKDRRRITMYNSMGHGKNDQHAHTVFAWVRHHLGAAFVAEEWTVDSRGISPQQDNADDCGVFTCTTARQLMLGMLASTPYDHTIMSVQRKRMIAELLNGGLLKADES